MRVYVKCPYCGTKQPVFGWRDGSALPELDQVFKAVAVCASAGQKKGCGKDFVAHATLRADTQAFKIEESE